MNREKESKRGSSLEWGRETDEEKRELQNYMIGNKER